MALDMNGLFPSQKSLYSDDGRLLNEAYTEGRGRVATLFAWGRLLGPGDAAASYTAYTVPAGKVLYIASAWMDATSQNQSGLAACGMRDHLGATTYLHIMQYTGAATQASNSVSIVFPSLIKYAANENVILYKSAGANFYCGIGFQGWLEDA